MNAESRDTAPIEAVVQVGTLEIPYRRAGHGPAVLLLLGSGGQEQRAGLLRRVAARYRVVEPLTVPADDDWTGWLRGLIDGLGLERPTLLADGVSAPRAHAFARIDPGRAGVVVELDPGSPEPVLRVLGLAAV